MFRLAIPELLNKLHLYHRLSSSLFVCYIFYLFCLSQILTMLQYYCVEILFLLVFLIYSPFLPYINIYQNINIYFFFHLPSSSFFKQLLLLSSEALNGVYSLYSRCSLLECDRLQVVFLRRSIFADLVGCLLYLESFA